MRYLVLLLLTISIAANSQNLKGKIVRIVDADIAVFQDKNNIRKTIKLYGIDCPKKDLPYWENALEFTQRKCEDKDAIAKIISDDNKQTFGIIYVNGININEALLIKGLAWKSKDNDSKHLTRLEENAKNARINIWSIEYPAATKDPTYETSERKVYICSLHPTIYHRSEACRDINTCKGEILRMHFGVARQKVPCILCAKTR